MVMKILSINFDRLSISKTLILQTRSTPR